MPVSSIVENVASTTGAHLRQHARQHGAQASPRNDARRRHLGEMITRPIDEGLDSIRADVTVYAVQLSRSGNSEAINAETAGDDLGVVVKQTDPRRGVLASCVVEAHRDRIAFHRIDVHVVSYIRG